MHYGITDILSLLGALGLFLYGMKVMSDALMELAGDRMRQILATTTSNRFFAMFTGLLITAIIQSSGATSLMVVSFTNAGLLTLTEAIGVIMGANVGTTVTAWIISILGFKVSMSAIALPLVGGGFLLSLSKDKRRSRWGYFIVGFALLFLGLEYLKDSVPDIRHNPAALAFLAEYTDLGYLSVILFLIIGTVLTLVVQSSSANMAMIMLMTNEGWIPYDMAAALILGLNIGTTVTANIAAVVGNYHAKRAALAHFLFNLIGTVWIVLLFYPALDAVAVFMQWLGEPSPYVSAVAIPVALSIFHSGFNIANTAVLIGFINILVRIVEWVIPAVVEPEPEIDAPVFLDESSLKYPETGIKALLDESLRLLENTAYLAIAHGLSVHRTDIDSDQKLKLILESSCSIPIDIDRLYATKIKSIYGKILEYATRLQSQSNLDAKQIETIRNILIADRMMVHVVKKMKPLHDNIDKYVASGNPAIRREYNVLRRRILKVVREIRRIKSSGELEQHIERLASQKSKAMSLDVLVTGRVNKLVASGEISREMATSLMNDSADASHIAQMLADLATLLYWPHDVLTHHIDEKVVTTAHEPKMTDAAIDDKGEGSTF